MLEAILRTYDLTKIYGKFTGINDINVSVKQGDIYGLVGENGAGKTTILKIITGVIQKSSGSLEIFGSTGEKQLNMERKRMGCIIEQPSFFPYLSAKKNLEYYRLQRGIVRKSTIDEVLELVGLADTGNKKFKNFSLGMKQRLGLALALLGSPDILILDEPINGLDPIGIVKFRETLKKLNTERNITILISSHILSELSLIATAYGFIHKGKLIDQCSAKALHERCRQYLSVSVDDTAKTAMILEGVLGCRDYIVLNDNVIHVFEYMDKPDLLIQALVSRGVRIYNTSCEGSNLESYFIDRIGGLEG